LRIWPSFLEIIWFSDQIRYRLLVLIFAFNDPVDGGVYFIRVLGCIASIFIKINLTVFVFNEKHFANKNLILSENVELTILLDLFRSLLKSKTFWVMRGYIIDNWICNSFSFNV